MDMSESFYVKAEREAVEKLTAILAKPLSEYDVRSVDEFDPWELFPLYGSYSQYAPVRLRDQPACLLSFNWIPAIATRTNRQVDGIFQDAMGARGGLALHESLVGHDPHSMLPA
jgi:hypothetical protein